MADGFGALRYNTSGTSNTAIGLSALQFNISGSSNTASGGSALVSNTSGSNNTASGLSALQLNTTGSNNTAIGYAASNFNTTGSNNIALGFQAGYSVSDGNGSSNSSNNIHIGARGVASDSAAIRIGEPGTHTSFFVAGVRSVMTGNNDAVNVVIDSKGQLGTVSSSQRFKEDIRDMREASTGLLSLRPVTYRYKNPYEDGSKPLDYGLIAEEVAEVYPDLVVNGANGQVETVQYQKLIPMLLNELQKEHRQVQHQAEAIALLQSRLEVLLSSKISSTATVGQ